MYKKIIFLLISLFLFNNSLFATQEGINLPSSKTNNQETEKKSYSELLAYLEAQGDGENLFYLANIYLNGSYTPDSYGNVVEKDTEKSIFWLKKSIELNFPYSAISLGSLYLYHQDFLVKPNNIDLSEHYLNISIKNGTFEAYTILADIYFNFKGNPEQAVDYLMKGSEKDIATSQYALAVIYNTGLNSSNFNIEKNQDISNIYLTKACTNKKKTKKIEEICYNSDIVQKEKLGD